MSLLGIDHIILTVRDIASAVKTLEDQGFTISHRPDIRSLRSMTRFICFADGSYIMVMQYSSPDAAASHRLKAVGDRAEGWADYGLHTSDIDEQRQMLEALGMPFTGPASHDGKLTTGDAWRLKILMAGWGSAGHPAMPYFVEDVAPRVLRIPYAPADLSHRNGATGIADLTVAVADLRSVREVLDALFGAPLESGETSDLVYAVGNHRLRYRDSTTNDGKILQVRTRNSDEAIAPLAFHL